MFKLLTYEAFVPKNIQKRALDLEIKNAKEKAEFEKFSKVFQKNVDILQHLQVEDIREQIFINLFQNVKIIVNNNDFNLTVKLKKERIKNQGLSNIIQYDYKHDIIYLNIDIFENLYSIKDNLEHYISKYFKISDFSLASIFLNYI